MPVMSEGLLLNSKYIKMGRGRGFSSFRHTATSCKCLPCGLTVIHLRLCDREEEEELRGSSLWTWIIKLKIHVAVAVVAQR